MKPAVESDTIKHSVFSNRLALRVQWQVIRALVDWFYCSQVSQILRHFRRPHPMHSGVKTDANAQGLADFTTTRSHHRTTHPHIQQHLSFSFTSTLHQLTHSRTHTSRNMALKRINKELTDLGRYVNTPKRLHAHPCLHPQVEAVCMPQKEIVLKKRLQ